MFDQVRLSVLAYHVEIMRTALYEHIQYLGGQAVPQAIHDLGGFLFALRNALAHTNHALVPAWDQKVKTGVIWVNIPVERTNGSLRFVPESIVTHRISFRMGPSKKIKINDGFIHNIELLSWHVLTIVKKQKISTLGKYLSLR